MQPTRTPHRGPTRATERALAPDLARGFMLLMIALANTPYYLWGTDRPSMSPHPDGGSALDTAVQFVMTVAVDGRIYPMFAFLFGYGIMRTFDRQIAAGADPRGAAALLRRRHLWLLVFGFVHAALLWMGDILGAYGLAGLVMCGLFLRRRERTIRVWAAVLAGLAALLALVSVAGGVIAAQGPDGAAGAVDGGVADLMFASFSEPTVLGAALARLMMWPLTSLVQGLGLIVPAAMLLGMAAGRRRVLELPGSNLRLLGWTAVLGISAAWLVALPGALNLVGLLNLNAPALESLDGARSLAGLFGGLGYVALFGIIGHLLGRRERQGVVVVAVTAVGKRSMTSYLAQSVICSPVLAAWGLGLGAAMHSASMALFAIAVWLVTVAVAYALERAGRRGPAEVLLRRLTYRRPEPAAPAPPSAPAPAGAGAQDAAR
ncbi:DUF418 domain-containing protein [Nocardiopsis mangrovi]|uniref:DUF418 domain-containing protein n=1 Tax=Nocardiopsis mangrovi TaxID=1179818 RepID=A0ABV9DRM5_9ACTN